MTLTHNCNATAVDYYHDIMRVDLIKDRSADAPNSSGVFRDEVGLLKSLVFPGPVNGVLEPLQWTPSEQVRVSDDGDDLAFFLNVTVCRGSCDKCFIP